MTKRLPTEIAINMYADKLAILQQAELRDLTDSGYFDEDSPCHIYFIGKRPRVSIKKDHLVITPEYIELKFLIQNENAFQELPLKFRNDINTKGLKIETSYPYTFFELKNTTETIIKGKTLPFLQTIYNSYGETDFLDLEIIYIGQSYGVDGARTAPDRLKNHSTLQGIYAEAISNNPDCEIWIALASFKQVSLTMFDGRTKFTDDELEKDQERMKTIFPKIISDGINEQQRINFTEAALIKYFQPEYNIIYKDTFPNPAHKTYSECYDLEINSVCFELNTHDLVNCQFYSSEIPKAPWHLKHFAINSEKERKSMFDFTE